MRGQVLALVALAVAGLVAPAPAQAQTYKMEKVDIKGEGGTDYASVDAATNRVFVSRSTHVMVVEGATGKVLGDIPNTPGVHGVGIAAKAGHGFTANSGDQTVTMFDLKTLAVVKQITVGPGLDGVMYNEPDDKIILTNHSRPIGTLTAIDPNSGDIVATVELEDNAPEGAAADGKGRIFVNNESKNTIQVIDVKTWKAVTSWPLWRRVTARRASPTTKSRGGETRPGAATRPAAARDFSRCGAAPQGARSAEGWSRVAIGSVEIESGHQG